MTSIVRGLENTYGVTFLLHSNSDNEIFPDNTSTKFTNILKTPVDLDINKEFGVCLSNIHAYPFQYSLVKDELNSGVKYKLGMFEFNFDTQKWCLLSKDNPGNNIATPSLDYDKFSKTVFTLVPSESFMGLDNHKINNPHHRGDRNQQPSLITTLITTEIPTTAITATDHLGPH